jgi:hypothetical protein
VVFGEQAWQDSIAIKSKFIAYSGEELKQDSLLVYYSIDGGEYQVAHMTPTENPDEYVGYITGYQGESSIDYYVFGADESGRRYTQPVFAELDPHHFTMEAHESTAIHDPKINVAENGAASVTVFNALGMPVLYVEGSNDIDTESLGKGFYIMKVTDKNGHTTIKKLVRE